jgi:hypothetical protein
MPSEDLYFHTTNESYFEIALLERLLANMLFKQSSFKGNAKAYNFIAACNLPKRSNLQYQRLIDPGKVLRLGFMRNIALINTF